MNPFIKTSTSAHVGTVLNQPQESKPQEELNQTLNVNKKQSPRRSNSVIPMLSGLNLFDKPVSGALNFEAKTKLPPKRRNTENFLIDTDNLLPVKKQTMSVKSLKSVKSSREQATKNATV